MAVDEMLTPARLTDFLTHDYPRLRLYMGETAFSTMARHCLAATERPKVRLLSRHLPDFLDLTKPFSRSPELSDLARLEKAFNAALNAPEASIIRATASPSVQRLLHLPPASGRLDRRRIASSSAKLDEPWELLVWRPGAGRLAAGCRDAKKLQQFLRRQVGESTAIDQPRECIRRWLKPRYLCGQELIWPHSTMRRDLSFAQLLVAAFWSSKPASPTR